MVMVVMDNKVVVEVKDMEVAEAADKVEVVKAVVDNKAEVFDQMGYQGKEK